jgi:hypothetical protein
MDGILQGDSLENYKGNFYSEAFVGAMLGWQCTQQQRIGV